MSKGFVAVFFVMLLGLASCQGTATRQVPEVLNTYPHDAGAFTQGLLLHDGDLYESTGLFGESSLREVNLETGEVVRELPVESQYFAEGLALVGDKLVQLTWQNGRAFVYDLETFNQEGRFSYETEGWGLCYDGEDLYMSDGSATLFERDAETFEIVSEKQVRLGSEPVTQLNELECVGDFVYAQRVADRPNCQNRQRERPRGERHRRVRPISRRRAPRRPERGFERYRLQPGHGHVLPDGQTLAQAVRGALCRQLSRR